MLKELLNNIPSILLYLAVFVVSAALMYCGLSFISKKKKVLGVLLVILGLIIPPILAGLRYKVGADYDTYVLMHNNVANGERMYFRSIEPASSAIIIGSAMLRSQFLMFFVFNLITICCFFFAYKNLFKKDNKKVIVAYFITLCLQFSITMNAVRSSVAVAIVTLALSFIINKLTAKNVIFCLLLIALAFLFHRSALIALIFLPAFTICRESNKKSWTKIVTWSLYMLIAIILPLIIIAARKLIKFGDYDRYLTNMGKSYSVPIVCAIMIAFILLISIYMASKKNKQAINPRIKYLWNCALFYIPLSVAIGWVTYVGGLSRVAFMLEPIIICLMACFVDSSERKEKIWKILIPSTAAIVVLLLFVRNLSWAKALPYQTYLLKDSAKSAVESPIEDIEEPQEPGEPELDIEELEDVTYEAEV